MLLSSTLYSLADLGRALRLHQVLRVDGVHHLGAGHALGLQRPGIEINGDQPLLSTVRPGDDGAFHCGELGADVAGGDVEQLLFGQFLATETKLQDRHSRGRIGDDQRRRRTGRKGTHHGL